MMTTLSKVAVKLATAFPGLTFDEAKHRYTHPQRPDGFTSVSGWCKQYAPAVDLPALARKLAAQGKYKSEHECLAAWDWERCRGTLAHAALELLGRSLMREQSTEWGRAGFPLTEAAERCYELGAEWLFGLLARGYRILAVELRVYSLLLGMAGTLDLLLMAPDGRVLVADWKTCRKLWTKAFRDDETGLYPELSGPFVGERACKLTQYACQVATYRHLLHLAGIETAGAILVHLPPLGGQVEAFTTTGQKPTLPDYLPRVETHFNSLPAA